MVDFMQSYVAFFSSNWIGLAILWVLLITSNTKSSNIHPN